ncbi:MAG: hypothetical protein AAF629_02005 [Chloroflexota bacterium]
MELSLNDQLETLIPLSTFRDMWQLPDTFSMTYFEPEERSDLGTLDQSGNTLNHIRETIIGAVSGQVLLPDLFTEVERLAVYFQQTLISVNHQIGLQQVEIDFARAGLEDILRQVTDHLVRAYYDYQSTPEKICDTLDFAALYQAWLNSGARIASTETPFSHNDQTFLVRVIYDPYGRVGLQVSVDDELYYVADTQFMCPAANYMRGLSEAVAEKLCNAFVKGMMS